LGLKLPFLLSQFSPATFIRQPLFVSFNSPQLLSKLTFNLTIFNYPVMLTLIIQNKSVVILLKMRQIHLKAAGRLVGSSKLRTEEFGPLDCQSTVQQK
jgi:hypothetical protein